MVKAFIRFAVNTATAFHGNELLVRTGSGTPARQPRWVEATGSQLEHRSRFW